ncbi:hypothetical protein [Allopusillimonas ginsengisoli]|uniref:hypothetical protein n=1 Tax=Allopusillimonas ginsengisoli TaxID=453575 RepID=UPI001AD95DB4|nr:hypothetical protein [Allopusillimonas ginsengisoli]
MRVAFFQPYLANWRIQFLEYFIENSHHDAIIYDGGYKPKNDTKSITGNTVPFPYKKLRSVSPTIHYKNQKYPFYFSPFLFFSLVKDRPEIIITEGEINFLNNLSIYVYCKLFKSKYIWWSLGKVRTRKRNFLNKLTDPIINFLLSRSSCVMARNTLAKDYYILEKKYGTKK